MSLTPQLVDEAIRQGNLRDLWPVIRSQAKDLGIAALDLDVVHKALKLFGQQHFRSVYMADKRSGAFRDHMEFTIEVLLKQLPRSPLDERAGKFDDLEANDRRWKQIERVLKYRMDVSDPVTNDAIDAYEDSQENPSPGGGSKSNRAGVDPKKEKLRKWKAANPNRRDDALPPSTITPKVKPWVPGDVFRMIDRVLGADALEQDRKRRNRTSV